MVAANRNQRMINTIYVKVVYVNHPGAYLITEPEQDHIMSEVMLSLDRLANLEPKAHIEWDIDHQNVEVNATPWEGANWPGLNREFYTGIDAAFQDRDKRIYFFKGDQCYQYTRVPDGPEFAVPRTINAAFPGLPTHYQSGIDAAVYRLDTQKVYFFKGSTFVCYTDIAAGIPNETDISVGYPNLRPDFYQGIDAALMRGDNQKLYFFKGKEYLRITNVADGMDQNYPKFIADEWPDIDEVFHDGIDAALFREVNQKIYLFKSDKYEGEYARFATRPLRFETKNYIGLDNTAAELVWLNPVMAAMGGSPGAQGARDYVIANKGENQWGFFMFFTKYPMPKGGYATGAYRKLGISRGEFFSDLEEVIAHETGHIFGGTDEYSTSGCSCEDLKGYFFREPNGNCRAGTDLVAMDPPIARNIGSNWRDLDPDFHMGLNGSFLGADLDVFFFKGNQYVRYVKGVGMDPSYPKNIEDGWPDLPAPFHGGIDAVFAESDGNTYFFKQGQTACIEGNAEGGALLYDQTIQAAWPQLPGFYQSHLDAVFRRNDGKIYFFKEDRFVRYSGVGGTRDSGYPKEIGEEWPGQPETFQNHLDTIFMRDNNRIYFFKGSEYIRFRRGADCLMSSPHPFVLCPHTHYHFGWGEFLTHIDAAVWRGDLKKHYMFSGPFYLRYTDFEKGIHKDYPKRIAGNWKGLPEDFEQGIDAAMWTKDFDHLYFFKGDKCVRFSDVKQGVDGYYLLKVRFKELDPAFHDGIDAAFWRNGNKKIYLFKGHQYVRYSNINGPMDEGYPKNIAGNWPDLPPDFEQGIDTVLIREDNQKIYFFKGLRFVRYTTILGGVDDGYPKDIDEEWMPFPRTQNVP